MTSSLRELDLGNAARLLQWSVQIQGAKLVPVNYEYNGQKVSYEKFECLLVGSDNMYCAAEVKSTKKNAKLAAEAYQKFTEESKWTMKNPSFVDVKLQYISSLIKKVINLQTTKMTKMDATMDGKWFAEPGVTLAQCADLQGNQMFDCMGFLREIETEDVFLKIKDFVYFKFQRCFF